MANLPRLRDLLLARQDGRFGYHAAPSIIPVVAYWGGKNLGGTMQSGSAWRGLILAGAAFLANLQPLSGAPREGLVRFSPSQTSSWAAETKMGTLASFASQAGASSSLVGLDTKPTLRLELGQHSAPITAIDVDKKGRYAITGSVDRTARIWELPRSAGNDIRLVQTLRPPIGLDEEGRIYAVAISPDGEMAAVAGWTGIQWDGKPNVYIFDAATGQILRRLGPLPQVTSRLAFSADGNFLAVGSATGGLRVYRAKACVDVGTSAACQPSADDKYDSEILGMSFGSDGRLATTSKDGTLRVYGAGSFNKPLFPPKLAPTRTQYSVPVGVTFSPDNKEIAIGYSGSVQLKENIWANFVSILDANDLKSNCSFYELNAGNTGGYAHVAWEHDGKTIHVAGFVSAPNQAHHNAEYLLRTFSRNAGPCEKGVQRIEGPDVFLQSVNLVVGLKALDGGGVVYASEDPLLGVLLPGAKSPVVVPPQMIDSHRTQGQSARKTHRLRLSDDGRTVSFAFNTFNETFFTFAPTQLRLSVHDGEDLSLNMPGETGGKIKSSIPDERVLVAVKSPDGGHVIGTQWRVRAFDKDNKPICSHPTPGFTRGLNVSAITFEGNQRLAVGIFSDGTIRWYRIPPVPQSADEECRELLAVFISPDPIRQRWLAWIPDGVNQGYYATSVGAEELVGWHVNRGVDKASLFYSIGKFRDHFNRPDVVQRVLNALDPEKALKEANAQSGRTPTTVESQTSVAQDLPPVVRILDPKDGTVLTTDYLRLVYTLEAPSPGRGGIKDVRILVDGADFTPPGGTGTDTGSPQKVLLQNLQPGVRLISVIAVDANGASEPAAVRVTVLKQDQQPPGQLVTTPPQGFQAGTQPFVITEPTTGKVFTTNYVLLKWNMKSLSAKPGDFKLLVNSQQKDLGDVSFASGHGSKLVEDLPNGQTRLRLVATTQSGLIQSNEITVAIGVDVPAPLEVPAEVSGGKTYVLVAGVEAYPTSGGVTPLKFAANDARDFYNFLKKPGQVTQFESVTGDAPLLDGSATKAQLFSAFQALKNKVGPQDTAVIFLSGHGGAGLDGAYYFMTHNATKETPEGGISAFELASWIGQIKGRRWLFIDSCRSGTAKVSERNMTGLINSLKEDRTVVISAGSGVEPAVEGNGDLRNGYFTYVLLNGLKGQADGYPISDTRDDKVTLNELQQYLLRKVPELMQQSGQDRVQTPAIEYNYNFYQPATVLSNVVH